MSLGGLSSAEMGLCPHNQQTLPFKGAAHSINSSILIPEREEEDKPKNKWNEIKFI